MSKPKPCSIERTSLQVIERKLLSALDNEDKVAILATKQNLEDMIFALAAYEWAPERKKRCEELADGMRQLMQEAFP